MADVKTFNVILETKLKDGKKKERKFDSETALNILTQKSSRWTVKESEKVSFNGKELLKK